MIQKCPTCDGIGAQAGAHTERVEPCPTCKGNGRIKFRAYPGCDNCGGTGKVLGKPCHMCELSWRIARQ